MEPLPSSVMSRTAQKFSGVSGSLMEPRRTRVGKHSLSVAVSVEDLLQVYIRQASPLRQVWDWVALVASNLSQVLSGLRRLPHE